MNILCFGDSNTWGFDADNLCRFPKEARWSSKLSEYLSGKNTISEFGICDMTFGTDDPFYKACNGLSNIIPAIRATSPIDYVIVALGINDCKKYLFNDVEKIVKDAGKLIFQIERYADLNTSEPRVILCEPYVPTEDALLYYPQEFDIFSIGKASQLKEELEKLCNRIHVPYCKCLEKIDLCADGCHFSAKGHDMFARNVASFIDF